MTARDSLDIDLANLATSDPQIEANLRNMVKRHDLGYMFSDDHSAWLRGQASLKLIEAQAALLPKDVAARIWNEVVDKTIEQESRKYFYWSEK